MAKTKISSNNDVNVPVTKQTAGGVTGAVVGGVIAGPVGAVIGGVAGAMMGNRAAEGKSLVSSKAVESVKTAATNVTNRVKRAKPVKEMIAKVKRVVPHPNLLSKAKPSKATRPVTSKTTRKPLSKKAAPRKRTRV